MFTIRWLNFICEIPTDGAEDEKVEESVVSDPKYLSIVDERGELSQIFMLSTLALLL